MGVLRTYMKYFLVLAGAALPSLGVSADPLSIREGRQLAETWCANCHVVGTGEGQVATAGVVSFAGLAGRLDFDQGSLAFALYLPHPAMPNMVVTQAEIKALYDYIRSLNPEAGERGAFIRHGEALVTERCGECHAVSAETDSLHTDAPSLSGLSKKYPIETLAEALAEGIAVGHDDMDVKDLSFDAEDIGAVLAYLDSIQEE